MDRYELVVAEFRRLTGAVHESSGRCCADVRDGAPRCCYQIADGADLQFTGREVALLARYGVESKGFVRHPGDGVTRILNRQVWTPEMILASTKDGILANSLECASHPTRPVVIDGRVVAVVAVRDCNTPVARGEYVARAVELRALWQEAVDLVGVKPYYVTSRLDDGLILL